MKRAMLTHIICMLFLTTIPMSVQASRMGLWPSKYGSYAEASTVIAVAGAAAVLFKCIQKYVVKESLKKNIKIIDKFWLFTDSTELNDRVSCMFGVSFIFIFFLEIGLLKLIDRFTIVGYLVSLKEQLDSDRLALWKKLKTTFHVKQKIDTLHKWYKQRSAYYIDELSYVEHYANLYDELKDKKLYIDSQMKDIKAYWKEIGEIPFTDEKVIFNVEDYYETSWISYGYDSTTIHTTYYSPLLRYGIGNRYKNIVL